MTDQCNLPEGFEAGAAIRIETGPELATTLVRALIEEVDTLVDMGRRGRGLAEERFVWSSVAEQYLALYDWAAAGGAAPEFVQFE
jgi:poly(glycerol-phosphate) alpha-glucosyltransferase